jgi:mannitol/fructose-specific phosphotransferase system IIA component (Ntr-type)
MIFGRSLEGIDFESIDNNPVNFVILFLIPESDNNHHLQTLASIARFFTKGNIRETLLSASTETEILKAIENHSK